MPLTNFDAVSKSFNTNRHDLFPTSYIPSFSPPFYTSLSDELFYPSAPPPQQQQQYKPQLSQQQNHDTQSYSEEESEIFEKDLPPEPKLENTRLRKRRRAYLWCKNKVFSVDWKGLTSRILTTDWLGPRTFPNLWMKVCKLWVIVALGALVMPLIVWIMIFIENTKTFSDTMNHYLGNDQSVYDRMDGDPDAGYVGNTNIPKHLGGVVFAAAFDIAMWVIIIIAACADLFWRFPICKQLIDAFYAQGLHDAKGLVDIEFFFPRRQRVPQTLHRSSYRLSNLHRPIPRQQTSRYPPLLPLCDHDLVVQYTSNFNRAFLHPACYETGRVHSCPKDDCCIKNKSTQRKSILRASEKY